MTTTVPDVEALPHDGMTRLLTEQITDGIAELNEANKVLLASESGTGVRDIDKELKNYVKTDDNDVSDKDEEVVKAVAAYEKARKAFKTAQEKARNLYRTNVLNEDAVEEPDVDKDALQQVRSVVNEAVKMLKIYAEANNKTAFVQWVSTLEIPQVGRQGTSVVGQKKPRAFVTVGDTVTDSFGEAAKLVSAALSTDDNKVTVSAGDLIGAWVEANEPETFTYSGQTLTVREKPKKADQNSN